MSGGETKIILSGNVWYDINGHIWYGVSTLTTTPRDVTPPGKVVSTGVDPKNGNGVESSR